MRTRLCTAMTMILVLGFAGCGRKTGADAAPAAQGADAASQGPAPAAPGAAAEAPRGLTYASDPSVYTRGVAISTNAPFCSGGAPTSYRISPALPPGLALDPASGAISGTPTAVAAQRSYEVTASNAAGSASATLTLTVNDQAPGQAPVVTLPSYVTASADGAKASTQDQGKGVTYEWTLTNGSVTSGQGTASITFKAGSEGTVVAQVSVRNSGGTLSGRAEAAIVPLPEATLEFPSQVRAGGSGSAACKTTHAGLTYTWSIQPGSASGNLGSGQGTPNISFTAGPTAGTFRLQLTVQNQAGNQANAAADIKVVQ